MTSTERSLVELALGTLGADQFDAIVCGDDVRRPKPAPEPYLRAARLLGVDPTWCLAIEDSPPGAASAEAAGCVVLVVPSELPVAAGARRTVVDSLAGLTVADLTALVQSRRARAS